MNELNIEKYYLIQSIYLKISIQYTKFNFKKTRQLKISNYIITAK